MKVTILGTGTSTGVPLPLCCCEVCQSTNPKNERLRASMYFEFPLYPSETTSPNSCGVLVDTTPDLRQQALRYKIPRIDSVLITHTHADHIFGMDDLRGFNFAQRSEISVYASTPNQRILESIFNYCFFPDPNYEGGAPPSLRLRDLQPFEPLAFGEYEVLPLPLLHGKTEVLGFRCRGFAYLTDCSSVPAETLPYLRDLDVLVLDGLRYRKHPTHFTLEEAVELAAQVSPRSTYLTHLSHEVEYEKGNEFLAALSDGTVQLAYDGLQFTF